MTRLFPRSRTLALAATFGLCAGLALPAGAEEDASPGRQRFTRGAMQVALLGGYGVTLRVVDEVQQQPGVRVTIAELIETSQRSNVADIRRYSLVVQRGDIQVILQEVAAPAFILLLTNTGNTQQIVFKKLRRVFDRASCQPVQQKETATCLWIDAGKTDHTAIGKHQPIKRNRLVALRLSTLDAPERF